MSDTATKIIATLADLFGMDVANVTAGSHVRDDLGLGSLDTLEAIMAVEEEFGIQITDEEAEKVNTVADLVALVEAKGGC